MAQVPKRRASSPISPDRPKRQKYGKPTSAAPLAHVDSEPIAQPTLSKAATLLAEFNSAYPITVYVPRRPPVTLIAERYGLYWFDPYTVILPEMYGKDKYEKQETVNAVKSAMQKACPDYALRFVPYEHGFKDARRRHPAYRPVVTNIFTDVKRSIHKDGVTIYHRVSLPQDVADHTECGPEEIEYVLKMAKIYRGTGFISRQEAETRLRNVPG
ncbi:hypothetical protein HK104_009219 [Borealophlyctis nickersoniae]|nr:hypothetical protein HK104_009219 [Borealophlyctis nickersoniae]